MSETRKQLASTLLLVLTIAAAIAAGIGFKQLGDYKLHDDGVVWVDRDGAVTAAYVEPDGPGYQGNIHVGDQLVQIQQFPIHQALDVPQALWQIPTYTPTNYTLRENGIQFHASPAINLREAPRDSAVYYQYVLGAFYLLIGLFVYLRRTTAAKSLHFYLLCLTSFIAACFHYSGKLNNFDQVIYFGNVICSLLAPAIFFHFCLTFYARLRVRAWMLALVYGPPVALAALSFAAAMGMVRLAASMLEMRLLLDRVSLGYAVFLYAAGAVVLSFDLKRADDPVIRRQLKYLRNGAILGVTPFALLYALPYVLGVVPNHLMNLSVLSMGLIPLTWAYAVTRYRLMDVDIIFQQGYVYTLATLAVIGTFYGLLFWIFNVGNITPTAFVVLIAFATLLFQPIRHWLQQMLDRWVFYRDRYDARNTMTEFARELSSETDQNAMLAKVCDRLMRTLSIQRTGVFLCDAGRGDFKFHSLTQRNTKIQRTGSPNYDLSFLTEGNDKAYLFFENPKHSRDIVSKALPQSIRETIADLDFTYYIACHSRGRVLAYLGISRTTEGDFLSSDDIELLITLSNYVAIAIENSRLYASLQDKVLEFERLKEFSENIVESINVGVLAVGLDDCVESWNSQIEKLTGISRAEAVGQRLKDLFPADLCEKFTEVSANSGVHNIYRAVLQQRVSEAPRATRERGLELVPAAPAMKESIVNLAVAPLISKDQQQIGRLIIFDDVTDRDELERRLVQADKLSSIGLLAAGVAHEVNTPLAVISTYAQMLSKQVSEDEPKAKLLDKIAKQTFRASEIVNSLLNFSRTSPTEFARVDLNKVIRETANLVEHQFQKAGVAVDLGLTDGLPAIQGNASKLQQVFLNLFLNARDAMGSGGALHVRSWHEGALVHVEVRDTGQGIQPEHVSRIYDPFFTTKGAKKGTGLGLSITYGIVQEHKGTIEVSSVVGKGTSFRLDFPEAATSAVAPPLKQALHA